jgi:ATP-binding cassette subfamily B protein
MANGIAGLRIVLTHVALTLLPVLVEFTTVALVLIQLGRAEFLPLFGASVLLYLLAFRFSMRRIVGPSRAMSRAQVEASAALQDLLANGETLKSFAAEPYARGRYAAQLQATEREFRRFYRNRAGGGLVVTLVFALSLAAALALAAHQVANGALTVGSFVLVNAYMLQMVRPLELVGFAMRDIGQGIAFLEQMDQLFRIPRERDAAGPDLPAPPRGAGELTFDRVSFGYEPGRKVLRDISFSVEPGMTLAIVGPSGSGKSSIARLLLRLYDPEGGRILLDGRPIDTMKLTELRRAVATVPQDISLFNATIDENVALAHGPGDRAALDRVLALAQLDDLLARLPEGGATMVGERGLNLSGGERQRVAIARAALRRPSIYVFDEATAALDARTEQAILARFRELARGCTTLIVAHRLASIIDADRILVLDQGLVVERGTHGELLRAGGLYASLWRLQHAPEGGQDVAQ